MSIVELRNFIGAIIVYQGFQFSLSLIFNKTGKFRFNIILALILMCLSLNFLNMLLLNYDLVTINFGPFFGLSYGPLFFLYTKALIYAELKFKKGDLFHFIPAIMGIFMILIFPEWLHLTKVNIILTVFIGLAIGGYLLLSYRKVIWFQHSIKNIESDIIAGNLSWLKFIILSTSAIFVIVLGEAMISNYRWLDELTILFLYLFVLIFLNRINNKGLKQPEIFLGITSEDIALTEEIENKYSTSKLTKHEASWYMEQLVRHMTEHKSFLQYELSLDKLAEQTEIPSRYLSQIINERFNKNFFDFVNGYRVEHAKKLLLDGSNKLRVNEVMYDAGFNSKSTFNHVFKKEVGCTPSAYRNQHK